MKFGNLSIFSISIFFFVILGIVLAGVFVYRRSGQIKLPSGDTKVLEKQKIPTPHSTPSSGDAPGKGFALTRDGTMRTIYVTDGTKHSVPLDEILSGGPPKDGIPSIDNPKFISIDEADKWLKDEETGTGLCIGGECKFYPYQILVWHEIVNDVVGGEPALISYCPLCFTGIVFERKLDGAAVEFGTSGKLWKSNLVMYNRTDNAQKESLWSQVLGEAIVGEFTGTRLKIIPSDVMRYGDWKKLHSNGAVLSKDTGFRRTYGFDPYGDYYTSNKVSFGASFDDKRLHPKEFVLGINIDGKFKAYHTKALAAGKTVDTFNGEKIIIEKNEEGEVRMFRGADSTPLPYIGGFWFSWLSVHPDTELYQ